MQNIIKAHNFSITVQGFDFGGREADFEKVCSELEDAACQLDSDAINSVVWDAEADSYTNTSDKRLLELAERVKTETLRALGWDKPHSPHLSLSAVLSR